MGRGVDGLLRRHEWRVEAGHRNGERVHQATLRHGLLIVVKVLEEGELVEAVITAALEIGVVVVREDLVGKLGHEAGVSQLGH